MKIGPKNAFASMPGRIRLCLTSTALVLLLFTLARALFLAVQRANYSRIPGLEILSAFAVGLRFDLHVVSLTLGPVFLFLLLPGRLRVGDAAARIAFWAISPVLLSEFLVLAVDIHYYSDAGRHLSYEIFTIGNDIGSIASVVRQYPLSLAAFVGFAAAFLAIWGLLPRKTLGHGKDPGALGQLAQLTAFFILLAAGSRGSFSAMPLSTSDAFVSRRTETGHLALNGVYTLVNTLRMGDTGIPRFTDDEAATECVRLLVSTPGTRFLDPGYPVYRKTEKPLRVPGTKRPNVVIVLLESWNGRYVGALGRGAGVTPRFDGLSRAGRLFTRFYSAGNRTNEALVSIGLGIPSFNGSINKGFILSGSLAQDRFLGLGQILRSKGYSTLFIQGARKSSMGLDGLASLVGFERLVGREEIDLSALGDRPLHSWGIWDHLMARVVNDELGRLPEPFFALWLTLSPHRPLSVPDVSFRVTPRTDPNADYLDALGYADESLGRFFDLARTSAYYGNTVFLLVGDHPGVWVGSLSSLEKNLVPLLILWPGTVAPGVDDDVGGQIDLLPTLLDLLGEDDAHHAFGRSLLAPGTRFAFTDLGSGYGWFGGGSYITVDQDGRNPGFYDARTGATAASGPLGGQLEDLRSFLQASLTLIKDNRLAPAGPEGR